MKNLDSFVRDAVGLVGATLVAYGSWLVYRPAGFIVAGALLVAGSLLVAKAGA